MTLRVRLLLVLVGIVAAGLVISDVVVYTQLRSYLVAQVDPQLRGVSYQVELRVLAKDGLQVPVPGGVPATHSFPGSGGVVTGPGGTVGAGGGVTSGGAGTSGGAPTVHNAFPFGPGSGGRVNHSVRFPSGTVVGEVVSASGTVRGSTVSFFLGSKSPSPPVLPKPLPSAGTSGYVIFGAASAGPSSISYQVLLRPLHTSQHLSLVVAMPLSGVDQTTDRLALVMLLVSLIVLIGLGVVAWWVVRRGLRPLDAMAVTAGRIAAGDLSQRVTTADGRTEVGRLGLSLNAMLGEIEEAFAARAASEGRLRRFLADASHELRTPLTSIRGYAEIFDLGARDRPEDLATSMHRIREEAERMQVLVDDLLLLAQLDRERPVERGPVDLVRVVGRAVTAAEAASPGHRIELAAPGSAMVAGDEHRLRQVMDNLLANALRHSPDGAPVEVEVRVEPVSANPAEGDWAVVEVADHGPGVPPEVAERIFEPFFRADSSRARSTGGAGLGLAIVAAIVREHAGEVGVRPGAAGGAVFWFRLPAILTATPQQVERVDSAEVA